MSLDVAELHELRKDFPSLTRRRRGKPPICLDNACMPQTPQYVIGPFFIHTLFLETDQNSIDLKQGESTCLEKTRH